MKPSKLQHPYQANGRTNFRYTEGRSGVYIIQRKGKTVYIGYSASNLYKTMYRHFQYWKHPKQTVISYYGQDLSLFKVRVILCPPGKAAKLEKALIVKHKPKDNPNKLRGYTLDYREETIYNEYQFAPVYTVNELEQAPF